MVIIWTKGQLQLMVESRVDTMLSLYMVKVSLVAVLFDNTMRDVCRCISANLASCLKTDGYEIGLHQSNYLLLSVDHLSQFSFEKCSTDNHQGILASPNTKNPEKRVIKTHISICDKDAGFATLRWIHDVPEISMIMNSFFGGWSRFPHKIS
ncbi:hypothetical protein LXL04_002399 [Taraxacum kok-saghyz]